MTEIITCTDDYYIFKCPYCDIYIQVHKNELNCKIFRHAIYKSNFTQINPHAPKEICDNLVANDLVWGCAKPFMLVANENGFVVEKCDYI